MSRLHIITCAVGSLGISNGLNIFVRSISKHIKDAKLSILSSESKSLEGMPTIPTSFDVGNPITTRWKAYYKFLETLDMDSNDIILLSDSRDLVFNANPTAFLNVYLHDDRPLFFSEYQLTGSHNWCRHQANLLGRYTDPNDLNTIEINGGVIAGRTKVLYQFAREISFTMQTLSKTKLSDQPVINKWARGNPHEMIQDRCLYCHGELVAQGRWEGSDPLDAIIYHQYDRIPSHKEHYENLYTPDKVGMRTHVVPRNRERTSNIKAVISHFNEDLSKVKIWLNGKIPFTIYSKSTNPPLDAIPLSNVGFEAQTWMYYFATNYDNLPKVSVCLQANPFDHFGRDSRLLRKQLNTINFDKFSFMPLSGRGHGSIQYKNGMPHHPEIGTELSEMWQALLGTDPPNEWYSSYGGMFAVHRDTVRKRPKEFYENASNLIVTKEQACAVERMWGFIFQ